jgi:protein-L-isoaspartate(D-aspartate) O-methyltransferase
MAHDLFHLRARGIQDSRVIAAMASVPRELFVRHDDQADAFADHPLSIGFGQTISQPFIVAWMTQALCVDPTHRVLEVGTGSGYQTAILAGLAAEVVSLEIIPELSASAGERMNRLGLRHVQLHVADGYLGWPDAAPYDRIVLTAAPPDVPRVLLEQLADGGRLVAPVGVDHQALVVIDRRGQSYTRQSSLDVRFVPMVHPDPGSCEKEG